MNLVSRGRLSVQRVEEDAWNAVTLMAEKGGFDALNVKVGKAAKASGAGEEEEAESQGRGAGAKSNATKAKAKKAPGPGRKTSRKGKKKETDEDEEDDVEDVEDMEPVDNAPEKGVEKGVASKRKRGGKEEGFEGERDGLRRSTRSRK